MRVTSLQRIRLIVKKLENPGSISGDWIDTLAKERETVGEPLSNLYLGEAAYLEAGQLR